MISSAAARTFVSYDVSPARIGSSTRLSRARRGAFWRQRANRTEQFSARVEAARVERRVRAVSGAPTGEYCYMSERELSIVEAV